MISQGSPLAALIAAALFLAIAAQVSACSVVDTSSITAALQNAIDSANRQSDAWRTTLPDLANKLADLESQASGDVKVTLADTINQVSALRKDTLDQADYLAKDTIAFALIQAQCSVSYFQQGVVSFLQYLKSRGRYQPPCTNWNFSSLRLTSVRSLLATAWASSGPTAIATSSA